MSIGHDTHPTHHPHRGLRQARFLRGARGGPDGGHPGPGRHGGGPHGHHGPLGRRLQTRRGALREAVLTLLLEQPMHGYQIMQELETRTGGRWRPSAGSVYPTLQQLEDEQLVSVEEIDGRRTFQLTDAGRTTAASLPKDRPWGPGRERGGDLRGLTRELSVAAMQVARVGTPATVEAAATILSDARRSLYRLLADDAPATDGPAADDAPEGGEAPA